MAKKGSRIGVVIGKDVDNPNKVLFAGYGVYVGDEVPVGAIGWMADMLNQIAVEHPECPATNPKLELDDGEVAWGCETWWGDEKEVKHRLAVWKEQGKTIIKVKMSDYRIQALERMKKEED